MGWGREQVEKDYIRNGKVRRRNLGGTRGGAGVGPEGGARVGPEGGARVGPEGRGVLYTKDRSQVERIDW